MTSAAGVAQPDTTLFCSLVSSLSLSLSCLSYTIFVVSPSKINNCESLGERYLLSVMGLFHIAIHILHSFITQHYLDYFVIKGFAHYFHYFATR